MMTTIFNVWNIHKVNKLREENHNYLLAQLKEISNRYK